jgi:hypothetical protein
MQPTSKFTHPFSIAAAALVALVLLVLVVLTMPSVSRAQASTQPSALARQALSRSAAKAKTTTCVSSQFYDNRKLAFTGRMQALPGYAGGKMEMRFDVLRKYNENKHYKLLHAQGLGDWLGNSEPTATVYVRNIALSQIETAARYKARVRYRWRDSSGQVIDHTSRMTSVCKQKTPLPKLRLLKVERTPLNGMPGDHFRIEVSNLGGSEARDVTVGLTIDNTLPAAESTLPSIDSKQVGVFEFDVAACSRSAQIAIDDRNTVREQNDGRKRSNFTC